MEIKFSEPKQVNGEWCVTRASDKFPLTVRFNCLEAYKEFMAELQKDRQK